MVKRTPGLQGLCSLRPSLAEVALVEAPLVADLREQLFELLDGEICVGECVRIGWPVSYFFGHTIKDIPNFLAQFHRKLLRGIRLALVRVNFVERPVVSGLGNRQSQGCFPARISRERRIYKRYLGEARAQRRKALRAWCAFNHNENLNSRNELNFQLQ